MNEILKAGQTVSCVLTVVGCLEMRMLNYEMADGNGVVVMSREKLTKSYMTLKSRATSCTSPFCAHIDCAGNRRWVCLRTILSHVTPAKVIQR
jgi:hypothetical protein